MTGTQYLNSFYFSGNYAFFAYIFIVGRKTRFCYGEFERVSQELNPENDHGSFSGNIKAA